MRPADPRLPLERLERRVVVDLGTCDRVRSWEDRHRSFDETVPHEVLAEHVGVTPRTLHRWREGGGVPLRAADRAATRLGYHPVDIWADWFEFDTAPTNNKERESA